MKRVVTVFAIITLTITGLFLTNQVLLLAKSSGTASDTMLTANQLYETGHYTQAAQAYQQLVDQGYGDSALYYNLGNAYFKQGDYARAILYYRQAEQLAPRDTDIEANLNMARAQIVDQVENTSEDEGFIANIANFSQEWFTLNELALVAVTAWIMFVLLIIAYTSTTKGSIIREGLKYALIVTTLVLTIDLAGMGGWLYAESTQPEGVVVAVEIDVSSGPGSQYVTEFTLHNGIEVDIVETRNNWTRLVIPNSDMQGWVPANAVETVNGSSS
jgi:hypothetical protein